MKIIIVGAGKIGEVLCQDLDTEGNDVILIEEKEKILSALMNHSDIQGLVGNGANYDILMEAGAADCDVFIAVTQRDEINIISSVIAKKLGAEYSIARVRNPEYAQHADFMRQGLGINVMLNPEREAAHAVQDLLSYPSALAVERFAHGRVTMMALKLSKESIFVNMSLEAMQEKIKGRILVSIVERGSEAIIPDGRFVLAAGDVLHVTGAAKDLSRFYPQCGAYVSQVRSLMIIGAGRMTYYLLFALRNAGMQIKVLENDHEAAKRLAEKFPEVTVIFADGTDQDILVEEGINRFDCVLAATGIDEENLLISMFAKSCGTAKTITKVNRTMLLRILNSDQLGAIITPKRIVADMIVRDVRSLKNAMGSGVETLYRLVDGRVEALQFRVLLTSHVVGTPLKDLPTRAGTLVVAIIRENQVIFPGGNDVIKAGDHIIVVSMLKKLNDVDDILERW